MARRLQKIAQPPIDPATRPSEHRIPLWGLLLALAAVGVILCGDLISHNIGGKTNSEWQMVDKARIGKLSPKAENKADKPAESSDGKQTEDKADADNKDKPDDFCPT